MKHLGLSTVFVSVAALLLAPLAGCSKQEDSQLKEDVSAIRQIKEQEAADGAAAAEESRKGGEARIEKLKARLNSPAASAPASAASR